MVRVRWERRAVKELSSLPQQDQQRVFDAVTSLRADPLKGSSLSAEWRGFRRLRVGSYRVIYAFDGSELVVAIVRVGHRKEIYR